MKIMEADCQACEQRATFSQMNGATLEPLLQGIIPPLATPLKNQNAIDPAGLERLIEHVIGGGVSAIFVLGTTGEAPSLSREVRLEMIRSSCSTIAGRVPVLVGITDTSYTETVTLGNDAADAGAAALVVAPPYYFVYSQEDLLRYVEQLAAELPLPLVLYNIPQFTKVAYSVKTVQRASQIQSVIGIKDSCGDLGYLEEVIQTVSQRPDFGVLIGPEEKLVDGMQVGACGGVCGGANLFPRLFVQMYEYARAGDWTQARRLQDVVREISSALYQVGDPDSGYLRGLKAALSSERICSDLPASPFANFSRQERERLEDGLTRVRAVGNADPAIARLLSS